MLNKSITMSSLLSLVLALIFTFAGTILARPILVMLDTPAHILDQAVVYLTTMAAGTIVVAGYNLSAAILRAFGDGKTPLAAMVISALLNIVLDLLFVMFFKWGVFGAALASVLSQLISFLFCTVRIFKIDCVKLDRTAWAFDGKTFTRLLVFGLPLAIQYVVINCGGMVIQATVNLQGSSFVAGYTGINKLYGILECSAIAFGAAFTTFASQNFGARNFKRVRDGVRTCNLLAVSASIVIMIPVLLLRNQIPQLFIDVHEAAGPEAVGVCAHYLTNMGFSLPFLYLIYVYRSNLQAVGDSIWSMVSGFVETIVRASMATIGFHFLGQACLFFIEPLTWLCSMLCVMLPYYFIRRKALPLEH